MPKISYLVNVAEIFDSELYARATGPGWASLPAPVRFAHRIGGKITGNFEISHGGTWLARKLARLLKMPAASEEAYTVLKISGDSSHEIWHRDFDGVSFKTRQWLDSKGLLVERANGWQLYFQLRTTEDSLIYEQRRAKIAIGPLRCPMPLRLSPRVNARETGISDDTVRVEVHVSLPIFGRLISYKGKLNVELTAP